MSNDLDNFAYSKDHLRDAIREFYEASKPEEIGYGDDEFIDDIKDIIFDETKIKLD